jgi:hypothetical protein
MSELPMMPAGVTQRPLRVYRRHNCERSHRSYVSLAKCIWPHHVWIDGDGPFASVAYCQTPSVRYRTISVLLHATEAQARESLRLIDEAACGGGCQRDHALVKLVLA